MIPDNMPDTPTPVMWPVGTNVQFCRVPWDSTYRDVVGWLEQDRDKYFDSIAGNSVLPPLERVQHLWMGRVVSVNLPLQTVLRYNYIRVRNDPLPGDYRQSLFYFVLDAIYVAPNTTQLVLQLDVWTTYQNRVRWGQSYVERGHVGIADNSNSVAVGAGYYGQYALTIPEGLDVGNSLTIRDHEVYSLLRREIAIMVSSTTDLSYAGKEGDSVNSPKLKMSKGSQFELGIDGTSVYIFQSVDDYQKMIEYLADYPHYVQGIQSITAIPDRVIDWIKEAGGIIQPMDLGGRNIRMWRGTLVDTKDSVVVATYKNFRDRFLIADRYKHLAKFKTWPYAAIEVTTLTGQSMVLQPELITSADLNIREVSTYNPATPRVTFYVEAYNNGNTKVVDRDFMANDDGVKLAGDEYINQSVTIDNFPRFTTLNNAGMLYNATNARSIAQSKQAASWAQSKALQGNQLSYDQASEQLRTAQTQQGLNLGAMSSRTALANDVALANGIIGGAGSLLSGDIFGAVTTAAGTAVNMEANNRSNAIETGLQRGLNASSNQLAGYMRDTNKAYADMAAKGDYSQAIAAINASVQDAQTQAPNVLGASGGENLHMLYRAFGIDVRWKQVDPGVMVRVGEYWLRYGYFVQNWVGSLPNKGHVMSNFTYWKFVFAAVMAGAGVSENYINTIRGIFENGVTVWRDPNKVNQIDVGDNEPIYRNYLGITSKAWTTQKPREGTEMSGAN